MNIKATQNMKFIKGPSAWFKHQVCTFILDADQIKQPDDSRVALLKELALPLPADSTSLGLWLAQLANAIQKFASYQGGYFSSRVLTAKETLIIAFAYFYNSIAFDPIRQDDQIRRQGGFIPGIRPGPQTERYLAKTVNRITLPGALFVAFIAILPYIVLWVGDVQSFPFAGTTVLIAVGVALELMRQVDSQLMLRNYEGFLK